MPYHIPVLLKETLELLNPQEGKVFVDATLGGGGHAEALLTQNSELKIIAFDQDPDAIASAKERLSSHNNIEYIQDNFRNLKKHIKEPVDGMLFDLGISSYQIDTSSRGFSVQKDGPLDMRMDQTQKINAADMVNTFRQEDLTKIFFEFGEERFSRRIAKAIINKRDNQKIETTQQLKEIIEKAIPTWKKRESVTRIFQALRIAINNELDNLKTALVDAIDLLKPGGKIVVISYHSLEDRITKHTFRSANKEGQLDILTKKPILATADEVASNPRARSAKLRAGEKK